MSTSKPKAYKRLLFVVLLMPHAPQKISIFIWIVYHADRQKATRFVLFIQRTVTKFGLQRKIITNPIQLAGAETEDNG